MERLTVDHLSGIVDLCPPLPGHRLTGAELRASLFADDQPTWVYGRPGVGVVATARRDAHGFVRLLVVAPDHRRHGIGRSLLTAAERQLTDTGSTSVTLGADAPHHLWAGVPVDAAAMCCLAESGRYERVGMHLDVDIPMAGLPADPGGWRFGDGSDLEQVVAFCGRHYPEWANEAARATVAGTVTLVFQADELTGFCVFDGNRRGALGPVAVRPDLVGRGAGRPALLGALHAMRARGDDHAAVQWVGPLRPYIDLGGHISRTYIVYRKALA